MDFNENEITVVSRVIKQHFPNLKVEETLSITFEILRAIESTKSKIEKEN